MLPCVASRRGGGRRVLSWDGLDTAHPRGTRFSELACAAKSGLEPVSNLSAGKEGDRGHLYHGLPVSLTRRSSMALAPDKLASRPQLTLLRPRKQTHRSDLVPLHRSPTPTLTAQGHTWPAPHTILPEDSPVSPCSTGCKVISHVAQILDCGVASTSPPNKWGLKDGETLLHALVTTDQAWGQGLASPWEEPGQDRTDGECRRRCGPGRADRRVAHVGLSWTS